MNLSVETHQQDPGHMSVHPPKADGEGKVATRAYDTSPDDVSDPSDLFRRAMPLIIDFLRTNDRRRLDQAIDYMRLAVSLADDKYSSLARRWFSNVLAGNLQMRFRRFHDLADINESIQLSQTGLAIPRPPEEKRNQDEQWLAEYGQSLRLRFQSTGAREDIELSVNTFRQAMKTMQPQSDFYQSWQEEFSIALAELSRCTGSMDSINESIALLTLLDKAPSEGRSNVAGVKKMLASRLQTRFELLGRKSDLEASLSFHTSLLESTEEDDPARGNRLWGLANTYFLKYEHDDDPQDLEASIRLYRECCDLPDRTESFRSGTMANLASALQRRYEKYHGEVDINEIVSLRDTALKFDSCRGQWKADDLNGLGSTLRQKYEHTGDHSDLESAITILKQALALCGADHPHRAGMLCNLADCHWELFDKTGSSESRTTALSLYEDAWGSVNATQLAKVAAAQSIMRISVRARDWNRAYQSALNALSVLPVVANRLLTQDDQRQIVLNFAGVVATAGALALECGREPAEAVEVIESGRSAIISLLIDKNSDIEALRESYPAHAKSLEDALSHLRDLKRYTFNNPDSSTDPGVLRLQDVRKLEVIVNDIRELPEFKQFWLNLPIGHIQEESREGPIIMINCASFRTDALVITPNDVGALRLPLAEVDKFRDWETYCPTGFRNLQECGERNRRYAGGLAYLWKACVLPVMKYMYQKKIIKRWRGDRVWWIGSGHASSLPFHAAGEHEGQSHANTFSHVVSSYIPSVKALRFARRIAAQNSRSEAAASKPSLVAICVSSTPDKEDLGATEEARAIFSKVERQFRCKEEDDLSTAQILDLLTHDPPDMVHFVCHGESHISNPLRSALIFKKVDEQTQLWAQDRFTVEELFRSRVGKLNLAYLSACSGADNRIAELGDEVLHLASGFQIAGFTNVVACMWPCEDAISRKVAVNFYATLAKTYSPYEGRCIAAALQCSIKAVRDDYPDEPLFWASYIHVGP